MPDADIIGNRTASSPGDPTRTEFAGLRVGDALLLTVPDVARLTNSGRSSVYEWIAKGWLPTVRIGRSVRVRRSDLESWVAALGTDAA